MSKVLRRFIFLVLLFFNIGSLTAISWMDIPVQSRTMCMYADGSIVWIGTSDGLFRVDIETGKTDHFLMYNSALPSLCITGIAMGGDGRLWIGTYNGLASYKDGTFKAWSNKELGIDERSKVVRSLISDRKGRIWACFMNEDTENRFGDASETEVCLVEVNSINTYHFDSRLELLGCYGERIVASNGRLLVFDDPDYISNWTLENRDVSFGFALDRLGNLYTYEEEEIDDMYTPDVYNEIFIKGDISFFAVSNNDLWQSNPKTIMFPGGAVKSLFNDNHGNIYVIADGCAYTRTNNQWVLISQETEVLNGNPYMTGTEDGRILVANMGKLTILHGPKQRSITYNNSIIKGGTHHIMTESSGKVWVATRESLISFDGTDWCAFPYPDVYEYYEGPEFRIDSKDNKWIVLKSGLYCLIDGKLTLTRAIDGVLQLEVDSMDHLWILTSSTLLEYWDGNWKQYNHKQSGLDSIDLSTYNPLKLGGDNKLYIFGSDYLFYFDNGKWVKHPFDIDDYFPDDENQPILDFVDDLGRVWLSSQWPNDPYFVSYCNGVLSKHYDNFHFFSGAEYVSSFSKGTWEVWGLATRHGPYDQVYFDGDEMIQPGRYHRDTDHLLCIDNRKNKWFTDSLGLYVYNQNGIDILGMKSKEKKGDLPGTVWSCSIINDTAGDMYVYGTYTDKLEFGEFSLNSHNKVGGFVAKLDTRGKWLWVRNIEPLSPLVLHNYPLKVELHDDKYILIAGPVTDGRKITAEYLSGEAPPISQLVLDLDGIANGDVNGRYDQKYQYETYYQEKYSYDRDTRTTENEDRIYTHECRDSEDTGPSSAVITCSSKGLKVKKIWELTLYCGHNYVNASSSNISIMKSIPSTGNGLLVWGSTGAEYIKVGNMKAYGKMRDHYGAFTFLLSISQDGTPNWIVPLDEYAYTDTDVTLLSLNNGQTIFSYDTNSYEGVMLFEKKPSFQKICSIDSQGEKLWSVTLGQQVNSPGQVRIELDYRDRLVIFDDGCSYHRENWQEKLPNSTEPKVSIVAGNGEVIAQYDIEQDHDHYQGSMYKVGENEFLVVSREQRSGDDSKPGLILTSYNPEFVFQWEKTIYGMDINTQPRIVSTPDGFVLGFPFTGALSCDNEPLTDYDSSGYLIIRFGYYHDIIHTLIIPNGINYFVSKQGDLYLYGDYNNVRISAGPPMKGKGNQFIAKFDCKGYPEWISLFDYAGAFGVTNDEQGYLYLAGTLVGINATFGKYKLSSCDTDKRPFIAVLNQDGNFEDLQEFGSLGVDNVGSLGSLTYNPSDDHIYLVYHDFCQEDNSDKLLVIAYNNQEKEFYHSSYELNDLFAIRNVLPSKAGGVYITGDKIEVSSCGCDFDSGWIISYGTNPERQWQKELLALSARTDRAGNLYFTSTCSYYAVADEIFIVGNDTNEKIIGKISPVGDVKWIMRSSDNQISVDNYPMLASEMETWSKERDAQWKKQNSNDPATWRLLYHSYGWGGMAETEFLPIFVNDKRLVNMAIKELDSQTIEYRFEVQNGDVVEYRIEDPWEANYKYEIYDQNNHVVAQSNPASPYIGNPPEPLTADLKLRSIPHSVYYSKPIHGSTTYPITGKIEWLPADDKADGYKLYWGETGQMKLVAIIKDTSWLPPQPMDYNTEYTWQVVPYNENGDAWNCPVWKYKTSIFTCVAQTNTLYGIADYDKDGIVEILYCYSLNRPDDGIAQLGYYKGFSGEFVPLFKIRNSYKSVRWFDADQDGDFDILQSLDNENKYTHAAYINNAGMFSNTPVYLTLNSELLSSKIDQGIWNSDPRSLYYIDDNGEVTKWIEMDADGDGDLDLLPLRYYYWMEDPPIDKRTLQRIPHNYSSYFMGFEGGGIEIMLNGQSDYKQSQTGNREIWPHPPLDYYWCDYDMDGDADFLKSVEIGNYSSGYTELFCNENGYLVPTGQALTGSIPSSSGDYDFGGSYHHCRWYDIDHDGDLDLILSSAEVSLQFIYINHTKD